LISYERGKQAVVCHACGATVAAPAFKSTGSAARQE
jgi:ribosomal protein S27E